MERSTIEARSKEFGKQVATVTGKSVYEFCRSVTTLLVGGLFLFYTWMSGIGILQSVQQGTFVEGAMFTLLFVITAGATIQFVAVINGVEEAIL
jgi:hypothetical protein